MGTNRLYLLAKDINPELERFICTGHPKRTEYQALSDSAMESLSGTCAQFGLTATYRSHHMDYMHCNATVVYPEVLNAATGMRISLIPWFTLPEHPFPIFVYAYAAWHYRATGGASQQGTADATGRLFGIESFHKSTVSRNAGMMEGIFGASLEEGCELTAAHQKPPTVPELAGLLPMMLGSENTIEILEGLYGEKVRRIPGRATSAGTARCAMDKIPQEYSRIIKSKRPDASAAPREVRRRPARPRKKRKKSGRPRPESIDPAQIENIRKGFIAAVEQIVILAATGYHRLLSQLGGMPATTPSIKVNAAQMVGRGGIKRPSITHSKG
jgi:hypothetical protein